MVNMHNLIQGMIGTVNPPIPIIVRVSTGNTTNPDGKRVPNYASPVTVTAQVQDLSTKDIHQTEGLNLGGTNRSLYTNGRIDGTVRVLLKGGDIIVLPDGTVWLVVAVPEAWPDWTKAIICLQNDSSSVALLATLQAQTY
jgi:hypothetical protein